MYYVVLALISIGIFLGGFILNFFARKEIKKMINNQIIIEQVSKFESNDEFNKLIKDIITEVKVTDEDIVSDPL